MAGDDLTGEQTDKLLQFQVKEMRTHVDKHCTNDISGLCQL